jgi:betaine-aldehyde dehydrogenase
MINVIEPATEQVIAELPRAGATEVDEAVARAREAFPGWRAISPSKRAAVLHTLADRLRGAAEELAQIEARNVGKPIADARAEIEMVWQTFRYYAGAPERPNGDAIPVTGGQAFTVREPLGVVGLIVPWNFPLQIAAWKLAPALAAGNTVVL